MKQGTRLWARGRRGNTTKFVTNNSSFLFHPFPFPFPTTSFHHMSAPDHLEPAVTRDGSLPVAPPYYKASTPQEHLQPQPLGRLKTLLIETYSADPNRHTPRRARGSVNPSPSPSSFQAPGRRLPFQPRLSRPDRRGLSTSAKLTGMRRSLHRDKRHAGQQLDARKYRCVFSSTPAA